MRRWPLLAVGAVGGGGLAYAAWLAWLFASGCEGWGCVFFAVFSLPLLATVVGVAWGVAMRRFLELWAPALCAAAAVFWAYLYSLRPAARPEEMSFLDLLAALPFAVGYVVAGAILGFSIRHAWRSRRVRPASS